MSTPETPWRVPPCPDSRKLDIRTTWSVEKRPRFGWLLRSHGLFHTEKSTAFAWTRKGAERKARRWSAPKERLTGAYSPLPYRRNHPPGTMERGRQPTASHPKPTAPVPIARRAGRQR